MAKQNQVSSDAGEAALQLLRLLDKTADAFPPLKLATVPTLFIADLIKRYHAQKTDWIEFSDYLQLSVAAMLQNIAKADEKSGSLLGDMEALHHALNGIKDKLEQQRSESKLRRFWTWVKDEQFLNRLRRELDAALNSFHVHITTTVSLDVKVIRSLLEEANFKVLTDQIRQNLTKRTVMTKLNAGGNDTTFEPRKCCLAGTRITFLRKIVDWIKAGSPSDSAQIQLLVDVAGSGKSAIAHTVARDCAASGSLASAFFFDREVAGRSNPLKLVASIAQDLAALDENLSPEISLAMKKSPRQNMTNEFRTLILGPLTKCRLSRPLVIVIDALDEALDETSKEGVDHRVLDILSKEVSKLPGNVRVLVTTRPEKDIMDALPDSLAHIQHLSMELDGDANHRDLSVFIRHRLHEIAKNRGLSGRWPTPDDIVRFEAKAEGLFIWAATMCDFMDSRPALIQNFRKILEAGMPLRPGPFAKMNKLYSTILDRCEWEEFEDLYQAVLGIIMAARVPLSISAMQALLDWEPPEYDVSSVILHSPIRTLLTGYRTITTPVRILHLSFRDFLTSPSQSKTVTFIDAAEHSAKLALNCLNLMVKRFEEGISDDTGFLAEDFPYGGVPVIVVEEAVGYACQHWLDHLEDIESSQTTSTTVIDTVAEFCFSPHFITWMEVLTSTSLFYRFLDRLRSWFQRMDTELKLHPSFPLAIYRLCNQLRYRQRLEEEYDAVNEALSLYNDFSTSTTFDPTHTLVIIAQASSLTGIRQHEECIRFATTALQHLNVLLASTEGNNCILITAYISRLYHIISTAHVRLERPGDALEAIQEAVRLTRSLPVSDQYDLIKDLPSQLTARAHCLLMLSHGQEATQDITEAISIYEKHRRQHPPLFVDLGKALTALARCHLRQDNAEQGLQNSGLAEKIFQTLTSNRPGFELNLAYALKLKCRCLARLGRSVEAIRVAEEIIEINQGLVDAAHKSKSPWYWQTLVLVDAYVFLADRLITFEKETQASDALLTAVELARKTSRTVSSASLDATRKLAIVLIKASSIQFDLGKVEEALAFSTEAIGIYRTLAPREPQRYEPRLAAALGRNRLYLQRLGRVTEAHDVGMESVELYRRLVQEPENEDHENLSEALKALSKIQHSLDRTSEALSSLKEAVDLDRELASDSSEFGEDLANSLDILWSSLVQNHQEDQALLVLQECVSVHRKLTLDEPEEFGTRLAQLEEELVIRKLAPLATRGNPEICLVDSEYEEPKQQVTVAS
ncbi:hypothetical protein C8J56DRAFT_814444 [Mycena floridula]|nr:hypothetical protein C8J56DRAFT_814444 [Mycena floridula]